MANLIRARGWSDIKPPPGSQIDWGHPLSQGLVGAWIANAGGGGIIPGLVSLADSPRIRSTDTKSLWTRQGLTTTTAGGVAVGYQAAVSKLLQPAGTGMSLVWRGVLLGNGDTSAEICVLWYNNNNNPFISWGLDRGSSGAQIRFVWNTAGTYAAPNDIDASPPTNRVVTYVTSWTFGSAPIVYRDGVSLGSVTGGVGNAAPTYLTSALQFNGGGANNRGPNATTINAQVYNRPLRLSEVQWLQVEPYAFVAPPGPHTYLSLPPPGNLVTGGSLRLHSS